MKCLGEIGSAVNAEPFLCDQRIVTATIRTDMTREVA